MVAYEKRDGTRSACRTCVCGIGQDRVGKPTGLKNGRSECVDSTTLLVPKEYLRGRFSAWEKALGLGKWSQKLSTEY